MADRRPDNPEPPERASDDRNRLPDVPNEVTLQPQQRDHPAAEDDKAPEKKRPILAEIKQEAPAPNGPELLKLVEAGTLVKVERDTLMSEPKHATPREPRYLTTRTSETIGETALQGYIADQYPGADREQLWPPPNQDAERRRSNEQPTSFYLEEPGKSTGRDAFDHVEIIRGTGPNGSDLFLIGEAKGGLRPHRTDPNHKDGFRDVYLSRIVDGAPQTEVVRAEQGSLPYFQSVALAMASNADPTKRAVGEALLHADLSQVHYVKVGAKIGHDDPISSTEIDPGYRRYLEAEQVPIESLSQKQYRKELIKSVTVYEFDLDERQLDSWKVDH